MVWRPPLKGGWRGGGGSAEVMWGSLARGPPLAKTFSHAFALTLLLWPFFSDEHAESGNPVFFGRRENGRIMK